MPGRSISNEFWRAIRYDVAGEAVERGSKSKATRPWWPPVAAARTCIESSSSSSRKLGLTLELLAKPMMPPIEEFDTFDDVLRWLALLPATYILPGKRLLPLVLRLPVFSYVCRLSGERICFWKYKISVSWMKNKKKKTRVNSFYLFRSISSIRRSVPFTSRGIMTWCWMRWWSAVIAATRITITVLFIWTIRTVSITLHPRIETTTSVSLFT